MRLNNQVTGAIHLLGTVTVPMVTRTLFVATDPLRVTQTLSPMFVLVTRDAIYTKNTAIKPENSAEPVISTGQP